MKGDFSKDTFRKKKHFHDVHMQQGRVLLDSDWNEQADIYEHRVETGTLDIVGQSGAPYHYAGFDIVTVDGSGNPVLPPATGVNIKISEGRFYVDGIMCENDAAVLFADQPDYDKTALPTVAGRYLFYIDVWQRHITALEDSDLREVALGGPDTTTRNKTVWQVKLVKTAAAVTCVNDIPASITDAPTGKLMARTELPSGTEDPCGLAVSGGYRRLENQLYRVEIHKGAANRAGITFKWSRDNGSVVVKWESVEASNPNNFVVSSIGRDELLGFKSGDWIEMIDDKTDLLGLRGPLVQLSKVDGNVITINPVTNIPGDVTVTAGAKNSRIRRWDSAGEIKPNTNNTDWIELEDGVQVQFKEGSFRTGDYWMIPARTATADIEWPFTDGQSPNGVQHHYAKLGIADLTIGAAPAWVKISDCRPVFPPLTELVSLNYVGGDGQEAMPGKALPATLKVGVANGQWAVNGAKIKFEIVAPGSGTLSPANGLVTTNAAGVAECGLTLGAVPPNINFSIQVKASLLDAAGNVAPRHLPVIFNASFSMAENVSYKSNCTNWTGVAPDTVAKALDQLCERKSGKSCCYTIDPEGNGDFKTLLEAIEKLQKQKEKDVCLCFVPGKHVINDDILMIKKNMSFNSLKISGYTSSIVMKPETTMELAAEKLVLQGFQLIANPENKNQDDSHIVLAANEINMDYCSWSKSGISKEPFISIAKAGLVYLKNNKIIAWYSLVLADGVQGILESNLISYLLIQNRSSNPFQPTSLMWTTPAVKTTIQNAIIEKVKSTGWSLTIRNNRIGAIVTDIDVQKPFNLYQDIFISENMFQFAANSFLAKFLHVTNNQFLYEEPGKPVLQAYIFGENIITIGNSGSTTRVATGPFNLLGTIDAIVNGAIRGNGSGASQILNLVNVVA